MKEPTRAAPKPALIPPGDRPTYPAGEGLTFRKDINGLRGVAVMLVVAFHLQLKGAGGGFIGVDVFFAISGYLMSLIIWRSMERQEFGYWRFIGARAARIWPALAAMLALLFLAGALALPSFDLEILAEQARWALSFLSNHYFNARAGYNTQTADTNWLLHTWSLSVEWQFYLLYPLVLAAAGLLKRRGMTGARAAAGGVAAALALLIALSWAWQMLQTTRDPGGSFFLLPSRAWEMLAGGFVYFLQRAGGTCRVRWRSAASHAGLVLILLSALVIAYARLRSVGLGSLLWLPVAGTALVLWADDARNRLLGNAAVQHIGRWSYSIYLWHWPVIVGLRLTSLPQERPGLAAAATVLLSVALGALSYRLVERLGMRRAAPGRPWRVFARPVAAMAVAGVATAAVTASGGLAFRDGPRHDFYRGYHAAIAPLYFPERCGNFKIAADRMLTCSLPGQGRPRVLVIGDSHGQHLYAWFARRSAVPSDFFTASECPPLPNFERTQPGYRCGDYAAEAWRRAASAEVDTVVVSARWATVGLAGAPYCHRAADGRCRAVAGAAKQALALAELKGAIERTLAAGKTVVVMAGSPESTFRVPERIARERFWYGEVRLDIDRRTLAEHNDWIDPLWRELQSNPRFHLVSLRERLCDDRRCRVYDDALARPIYLDESHFDPVWIASQADLFAPYVRAQAPLAPIIPAGAVR